MMDILFATGQILCLAAIVYGGYLVLTRAGGVELRPPRQSQDGDELEESEILRKYRHYDS